VTGCAACDQWVLDVAQARTAAGGTAKRVCPECHTVVLLLDQRAGQRTLTASGPPATGA
jgi:hypothetical protein